MQKNMVHKLFVATDLKDTVKATTWRSKEGKKELVSASDSDQSKVIKTEKKAGKEWRKEEMKDDSLSDIN